MTTMDTDENNDIFLSKKGFAFIEGVDAVANVVERLLKTQMGELQLDTGRGVPWFETIFASQRNSAAWEAKMRETIKSVYGVLSIVSFEYQTVEGVVTYQTKFTTIYGEAAING